VAAEVEDRPAEQDRGEHPAGRDPAETAVVEAAEAHRGDRPGQPRQAEEADLRLAEVEGRVGEQEGERRPDQAEARIAAGAEDHPPAQQRLLSDQRADAAEQGAVAERGRGTAPRHRPPERHCEHRHRDRGEGEDGAPPGDAGDQPGEGAGEQHAGQQAAHHHADDVAAFALRGERAGEGDEDLGDHRGCRGEPDRQRQDGELGSGSGAGRGEAADRQQRGDQLAAVDQVAERGEKDEPEAVSDLRDRDQQPGGAVGDAEVRGDRECLTEPRRCATRRRTAGCEASLRPSR
jgi:hypothetical protein